MILQIILLAMRLGGMINWEWWVVLLPLELFVVGLVVFIASCFAYAKWIERKIERNSKKWLK